MLASGPPVEFIDALAFPLPGETVFRFIGFPEGDDETLKHWCSDRKAFSWGKPSPAEQIEIAEKLLAYWRYCRDFTAAKRDARDDDFASELLDAHDADPDDLTYREVESIIYGLSFAGHEAVTNLICNCLVCLLPRRDQWNELVADPSLIPNAVEEVLRFESSQISWRRITTQPTTLAGLRHPGRHPDLHELRVGEPPARRCSTIPTRSTSTAPTPPSTSRSARASTTAWEPTSPSSRPSSSSRRSSSGCPRCDWSTASS